MDRITFRDMELSECYRDAEKSKLPVNICPWSHQTKLTLFTPVVPGHLRRLLESTFSTRSLSKTPLRLSQSSPSSYTVPHFQSLSSLKLLRLSCLVLFVAVVVQCEAQDVIKQTNLETEAADTYLSTFGYYPQQKQESDQPDGDSKSRTGTDVKVGGHTEVQRHRAIERLQTFFHLPVTGQLDINTKKMIKTARCGRKDIEVDDNEKELAPSQGLQEGNSRVKRYSLSRYGDGSLANWNVSQLTWRITRPSRQISESQQREIIRKSLAVWAQYMPVNFVEDRSQNIPDIDIHFARGEHGPRPDPIFDGSPEGLANVLAHAWGPGYNSKGLAGDVHFDDDDNWKDYNTLLGVAVHELGHSMGLGHSNDQMAIMYPVYRDVIELGQDDINGIKEMYGSSMRPVNPDAGRPRTRAPIVWTYKPDPRYPTNRPDPPYRTERPNPRYSPRHMTDRPDPRYRTQRPDITFDPRFRTDRTDPKYRTYRPDTRHWTKQPDPRIVPLNPWTRAPYYTVKPEWLEPPTTELPIDLCAAVNVDAVFEDPDAMIGRVYIAVSNENVHTLTQHGVLLKSELLNDLYPNAPINPDVAFSISKKRTVYFIKGDTMWAYKEGKPEEGYPRSLRSLQFPERPKFSVTINQRDGSSRLLLFGARFWWMFDVDRSSAIVYQPISSFSGELPSGVRFAAQWIDNNLYAVTQDSYVIMDLERRRITHEKPIAGKPQWLQALCGHASRVSVGVTSLLVFVVMASILKSMFLL